MKAIFYIAVVMSSATLCAQVETAFTNFRIFPSGVTQTEPVLAIHSANPLIMFASAVTINTNNGFRSEGVYVSTNGGLSWHGSDTCAGAFIGNHGGDPGVAVHPDGTFIITHIGSVFPGVYGHYSTDRGTTWSNAFTITANQPEDKGTSTIDNDPRSPFYGRCYAVWVDYIKPYSVLLSYSADTGRGWTTPSPVFTPSTVFCSGGNVKTGADGNVYVCWAGLENSYPYLEDSVGFAVSTDGGVSYTVSQNIFDMNGIGLALPTKNNIRVNSLPQLDVDRSGCPRNGWIYVATTEKHLLPAGNDPDIVLHRSTDGGKSWSGGIRVNQDAPNNGKIQYFPGIVVDSAGGINILYYDDRNTSSDSAEIMLARSLDGGSTWTERVISDHRFQPKSILGGPSTYQGDRISLKSAGGRLFALWMDDFSGLYQVWSAIIDLRTVDVRPNAEGIPAPFELCQNYPNPFNPTTNFGFRIANFEFVSLKVYDVLGREIATLVNEVKQPGEYTVRWNAERIASGVYLYRLEAIDNAQPEKSFVLVRSMVLLK